MEIEKIVTEDMIKNSTNTEFEDFLSSYNQYGSVEKSSILIDEIHSDNHNIKLFCINNLHLTSDLLGVRRTEEELIPMIIEILMGKEDNEEVLTAIANKLLDLSKGPTSIRGLEILAGNDDELVRSTATCKLCELILSLDENSITNEFFPLMKRLIDGDIKSKISCSYLFPVVCPRINSEQIKNQLVQAFFELSREDAPSVRRAAAFNIRNFNEFKELLPLLAKMLKDAVDIVRAVAVESCGVILKDLDLQDRVKIIKQLVELFESERSWRVRHCGASVLVRFSNQFENEFTENQLLPVVVSFLKDSEPEVKVGALSNIEVLVGKLNFTTFSKSLLPIFTDLLPNDTNFHVRSMLISKLFLVAKFFDETQFFENIFPTIKKMLREDTSVEVKTSSLSNIEEIFKYFENEEQHENLNHIIDIFTNLSKEPKWRIRLSLAEKLKVFAKKNSLKIFNKYIWHFTVAAYNDNAHLIREEALLCLVELFESNPNNSSYKSELVDKTLEILGQHSKSANYILRINAIYTLEKLYPLFSSDVKKSAIKIMITLKNDKVPNVRFCLASAIGKIEKNSELNEMLKELSLDVDQDVRFYALEALNKFK